MGYARSIGRVGALAVAMGVGVAVASSPGVAYAEPSSESVAASDNSSSGTPEPSGGTVGPARSSPSDSTASDSASSVTTADGGGDEGDGAPDEDVTDDFGDAGAEDFPALNAEDDVAGSAEDNETALTVEDGVAESDETNEAALTVEDDVAESDEDADDADGAGDGEGETLRGAGVDGTESAAGDLGLQPAADHRDTGPTVERAATALARHDSGRWGPAKRITPALPGLGLVSDTDSATAAAIEGSVETGGQLPALRVEQRSDAPIAPPTVAPVAEPTMVPALAVSSPAAARPLQNLATGVVRVVAKLVVAALDLVLPAGSGGGAELPFALAALAWVRREIDQTFLAPHAAAQQAAAELAVAQSANLLVNPGAELATPSLSGNSSVAVPGWEVEGTPTVIEYGTPRNFWPVGLSFPMPNLPPFLSFPRPGSGPPDGGANFFGGGNVGTSNLTQMVDLSAAAADIDGGAVTYNLSGWLGGYLLDPDHTSVKVDFLDANRTYLGTTSIGPVRSWNRLFQTKLKERETSGVIPINTRYAQVDVILAETNPIPLGFNIDYNSAFADNLSFTISSDLPAPPPPTPPVSNVGELDHFFMVYMENKGYNDILGSPDAPYLNSLINAYGFADN